jgi:hypothetical protein
MTRGAELYDLFMALRYDRPGCAGLGVWKALCRLAMLFREEDVADRAGRKSWRSPKHVLGRRTDIFATVVARNIMGARRA